MTVGETSERAVEARGLTRRFGDRVVLDGLDLTLSRGEVFGLLGPNGAGKSTTINLFMGFLRPSAGAARVLGLDCTRDTRRVMSLVGHLPEEPSLFENLTGRETLSFTLSMRAMSTPDRWRAVEGLAERIGLRELDQLVAGYSMGMRKKLAFLIALAHDPEVLFLDEPTNGLDPVVAREVRGILEERAGRGVTVLLSTHLLDVAARVCQRLGVLSAGRLRALGTPDEVCAQAGGAASLEDAFLALTGRAR